MEFSYFSQNGELRPLSDASVSLSNIEYQYGFGVYETIRVVNGVPYFTDEHTVRLIESARIIGLIHPFTTQGVEKSIAELVSKTGSGTYNLKVLLIGGAMPILSILPLNPHFPDKKLYRDGVACRTYEYERAFPHAKTLNMLQSYLAYGEAKKAGAYDALLIDRSGSITEGTRTNFFCIQGKVLVSPPEEKVLLGVTRKIVLRVAAAQGFEVIEKDIRLEDLSAYEGAFLTSTSSGIMPIASVGDFKFPAQPVALKELMSAFDAYIAGCGGTLK